MSWIEAARVAAAALVGLSALWFCVSYHRRTGGAWRRNPYGVHMMVFSGAFVAYMGYAVVSLLLLPDGWRPYSGTAILLSLAGLFIWRTRLLRQAQREPVDASTEEK